MTTPTTPDAITTDWLEASLPADVLGGGKISSMTIDNIGEGTGIFGEIVRLNLAIEGGNTDSFSIVAKMPCVEPANLEVALMLGIYEREMNMFDFVLDQSPMRGPRRYVAERGDNGTFILLLEDLAHEFDVGDQIIGADLSQAESIIDTLAAFHAHWWESPKLDDLDWLPRQDAPQYQAAVPGIYRAGLPVLVSDWGDRVSADAIALAQALEPKFEEVLLRLANGPETLIHTDTRLDNILFAKDGSGGVAFIDFQLALRGRGVADIAYLLSNSVPTEIASANWESLLARWHDSISAAGVTGYSLDDARTHYREAVLFYLSGPMSLIGSFDSGNERGAAMTEAWVTRAFAHAVEIDAGQVL